MVEEYIYKEAETLKRRKRGVTMWQQFLMDFSKADGKLGTFLPSFTFMNLF